MVEDMPHVLEALLDAPNPELRASAAFALGSLLGADRPRDPDAAAAAPPHTEAGPQQREVVEWLVRTAGDCSPLVRSEAAVALARFASTHRSAFQVSVHHPVCTSAVLMSYHLLSDGVNERLRGNNVIANLMCSLPTGRYLGDAAAVGCVVGAGGSRSHTTSRSRQGYCGRGSGCGIAQHARVQR
jgi:HEAT repeats